MLVNIRKHYTCYIARFRIATAALKIQGMENCCIPITDNKILMGEVMKEAAFSLAEAKFTAGDFSHTVIQNVSQAQYRVRMKKENVVG
uniref:CBS domain-containing protein n=1 Tax=Heterorhabditis bacteriophora TaxID=37862 RepID=A0A1I7XKK5_HETBA